METIILFFIIAIIAWIVSSIKDSKKQAQLRRLNAERARLNIRKPVFQTNQYPIFKETIKEQPWKHNSINYNSEKIPTTGFSEHVLEKELVNIFRDKVKTNTTVNYKYPDIALVDYSKNFCLDIEIDEVYTLKSKEIIHTKGADNERDLKILDAGWHIVRFSEEQVIKQTASCCKIIAELYSYYTLNKAPLKNLYTVPEIVYENQWDYNSAKQMLKNNYRRNLLAEVKNEEIIEYGEIIHLNEIEHEQINGFRYYANKYYSFGFNVTCVTNTMNRYNFLNKNVLKSPSHDWRQLLTRRQERWELNNYNWNTASGIGFITGLNDLCAIDVDNCTDFSVIIKFLEELGLPENYEWVVQSGSKNGFHIIFKSKKPAYINRDYIITSYPPNDEYKGVFEKAEIIWNFNLLLPPSKHKTGENYKFLNVEFPKSAPLELDNGENDFGLPPISGLGNLINSLLDVECEVIGEHYERKFNKKDKTLALENNLNQNVLKGKTLFIYFSTRPTVSLAEGGAIYWITIDKGLNIIYDEKISINNTNTIGLLRDLEVLSKEINFCSKIIGFLPFEHLKQFKSYLLNNSIPPVVLEEKILCLSRLSKDFLSKTNDKVLLKTPQLEEIYFNLFKSPIIIDNNNTHYAIAACYIELLNQKIIDW